MKCIDKNLSGKSDDSFRTAKGKLSPRQRPCFIASNMVFHTTKRYLWRSETIPLANSFYVNRSVTDDVFCNYLSANKLQKTSKNAFFPAKNIFVQNDALYLGSKFEYYLTNTMESPYSSF